MSRPCEVLPDVTLVGQVYVPCIVVSEEMKNYSNNIYIKLVDNTFSYLFLPFVVSWQSIRTMAGKYSHAIWVGDE